MKFLKFLQILDFQKKSHTKAGDGLKEGAFPFFTSSPILSKYSDFFQFDLPSLIFGTGGSASVHICEKPFSVSTDCLVAQLKPSATDKFKIKFVYYYLFGNIWILERGFKGAGLRHISKGYMNNIDIPELPLEDQKRIVRILDEADALRQKRKQAIGLLDDYLKAVFLEMFGDPVRNEKGWAVKRLGENAFVKIGPFGSLLHKSDYIKDGIPLVNPKHLVGNKILVDPNNTVSKSKHAELKAYHMREGDIVLARRGEIGRCGLVTKKENEYLCGTGSMFIRAKKSLCPIFLICLISTSQISEKLLSKAKGITMKNLNADSVKNIELPMPPIEFQNKFAAAVEVVDHLKQKMHASLAEMDNLFNALMQRLFG